MSMIYNVYIKKEKKKTNILHKLAVPFYSQTELLNYIKQKKDTNHFAQLY